MNTASSIQTSYIKQFLFGFVVGICSDIIVNILLSVAFTFLSTFFNGVFNKNIQLFGILSTFIALIFGAIIALIVYKKFTNPVIVLGMVSGFLGTMAIIATLSANFFK